MFKIFIHLGNDRIEYFRTVLELCSKYKLNGKLAKEILAWPAASIQHNDV